MKTYLTIALTLILSYQSFAQSTPQPAETIMKEAYAKAAKENKKVLLIFHASWCSWCRKMEASINDPACSKLFDDNYVIAYLDVLENAGKKALENPGSDELLKNFDDKNSSLPFFIILDAKGNAITDSNIRENGKLADPNADNNMGCPALEKEVNYFAQMLRSTSKLSDDELAAIKARFRKNETVKTATGTN
ncbi:thioredoxin family protein [Mucilaginibacter ginsenosidivorans]|uniref:Thioredoxin family protein n=1 Tax=Mucilaginibacter ginsenosidivorans TaxID=398053 RepID=A0A5B8UVJ5_9SPHI|nr:thioredoxin family protein [Mucilaginibacter ginsenosidivorans]QEC63084.1 thioredoxin family protein [Mucilaginibacter ginsenosidivorans]